MQIKLVTTILVIMLLLLSVGTFHYFSTAKPTVTDPVVMAAPSATIDYALSVKPVIEQRCVVCHACYDAPCQLKLGSYEGITRGANTERVYDGERLIAANLTRLFEDAHSVSQWREKSFFPVVADVPSSPTANSQASVLSGMLSLKKDHPLPAQKKLSDKFELGLNRQYQCPTVDEFEDYKADYPLWGMPYGLPALEGAQHQTLTQWVAEGAKGSDDRLLTPEIVERIAQWEIFFNQPAKKAQLMSRYLFEHLFLVHLHFDQQQPEQYFKLVRSKTPPGQEVEGIYTRRPFDDPKVERVYYRIIPVKQSIVHKAHMPLSLNGQRKARWSAWFLEADYQVDEMPSYHPEKASNPFITFAAIPVQSRYKYMLDESQNTIMQFIKGPVCRGQLALNVINDHFWVVFAEPELKLVENDNGFMQQALQRIRLPAEKQSTALPTSWISYAAMERDYLHAKSMFIKRHIQDKVPITLDLLWDGEGENDNLALTVFRHNDAATVVKGLIGDEPQTAWVLTYPLFERIHYLLVAGYDVYGNVGHQLNSRMYMDFLRMEGEFNFLSFLPQAAQEQVRDKWYRGSVSEVQQYVYKANEHKIKTDMVYKTDRPLKELYQRLKKRVAPVASQQHDLTNGFTEKQVVRALGQINSLRGKGLAKLPNSIIIKLYEEDSEKQYFYTMLRHSAHSNISHLFGEQDRRLPDEDTVTIAPGFMTSHPNAFMQVSTKQLEAFAQAIARLNSEQDYEMLMDNFGVRRTSAEFWSFADNMHTFFKQHYPVEYGLLDFNRLENR
ncbi:fatty acid cis/trans isomerase [Aliiglaciecola litoralis]|uniref:Fatty acid cis/trans isomerase n=1 Tax=Aliiglaciecola litoralis TaxID=582857 RepID=A0ABN1LMY1_9ALTE